MGKNRKKIRTLAFLTVLMSFFSWILWAFFTYKFIMPESVKKGNAQLVSSIEQQIKNSYSTISKSVVNIIVKKKMSLYRSDPFGFFEYNVWDVKQEVWGWTWFFVTDDWIILTNKHVVWDEKAEYTVVTSLKDELEAEVVYRDKTHDLALVKVDLSWLDEEKRALYKKLEFSSAKDTTVWQFAIAIWNTLAEFPNTITLWIISWEHRQITVWNWDVLPWLLQTDAAINPWNSGGPLMNLNWKVVWVNTAIVDWWNWIWFAIPLTPLKIEKLLEHIKK